VYGEKNRENALHFPSPVKKKFLNKLFPIIMYNPKIEEKGSFHRKSPKPPQKVMVRPYLIN